MNRVFKAQNREAWTIRLALLISFFSYLLFFLTEEGVDFKKFLEIHLLPFVLCSALLAGIILIVFRKIDLTREALFSEHSLRADSRKMSITIKYCDIIEVCICRRRRNNRILQIIVTDNKSSLTLSFFKEFDEIVALLKEQLSEEQFTEARF